MRLIGNPNQLPSGAPTPSEVHTKPRVCAVIPHRTEDPEGFIETRNTCQCGQPVIVSIAAVREMAGLIGMADRKEVDALTAEFEERIADQHDKYEALKEDAGKVVELEKARKLVAAAEGAVA